MLLTLLTGAAGYRLSKKGGNYLGKVRSNFKKTDNTIYTNDQEKEELGAVLFEKPGIVDHVLEGSQPRKFYVMLPPIDADSAPIPHKV
jgi:tubby and related proteins